MVTDPVEPLPTTWVFDLSEVEDGEDMVAVGGDLRAGTLVEAYRSGVFPMGLGEDGARPLAWWSPDPRTVFRTDRVATSKRFLLAPHALRGGGPAHANRRARPGRKGGLARRDRCSYRMYDPSRHISWRAR